MKKLILFLCLMALSSVMKGQSYHFSQFFSTPLLTNPAHTGFTEGPFRLASNIRSQGIQGNPFFTGYISADASVLRGSITEGHKAGIGMYIMNDQSLTSAVQTNSIGFSAAYNVGLDIYGERSFGLGIQGTYNQRRIDYTKLSFESQYGPSGYDPSLLVGEPLDFNSKHFFDLNAGVMYNSLQADKAFFAGFAVYNILRHKQDMSGEEFKMPTRYTLQGGAQFVAGKQGRFYTSLTALMQAGAYETTVGTAYGLQLTDDNKKNELIGGVWYRLKDAVIPYIGYQYTGFQLGISYDYTLSAAKASGQIRNAYELTLMFKSPDKRELKTHIPWF